MLPRISFVTAILSIALALITCWTRPGRLNDRTNTMEKAPRNNYSRQTGEAFKRFQLEKMRNG